MPNIFRYRIRLYAKNINFSGRIIYQVNIKWDVLILLNNKTKNEQKQLVKSNAKSMTKIILVCTILSCIAASIKD